MIYVNMNINLSYFYLNVEYKIQVLYFITIYFPTIARRKMLNFITLKSLIVMFFIRYDLLLTRATTFAQRPKWRNQSFGIRVAIRLSYKKRNDINYIF